MVLELDLHRLTLQQIEHVVTGQCSKFGKVQNVGVYLYPIYTQQHHPFALVEMATPEENERLRRSVGGVLFGKGVVVYLVHNSKPDRNDSTGAAWAQNHRTGRSSSSTNS